MYRKSDIFLAEMIIIASILACGLSKLPTPTPVPTKLVPDFSFRSLSASYLKDCRNTFPLFSTRQVGYQNLYPGTTTSDQIANKYGRPKTYEFLGEPFEEWDINVSENRLIYDIIASKKLVDFVSVYQDENLLLSATDILEKFGCPDLIIAVELEASSLQNVNFNTTFFVYANNGIEFRFEGFPITYSSAASGATFTKPHTLEEYLRTDSDLVSKAASPVTLKEAIIDQ